MSTISKTPGIVEPKAATRTIHPLSDAVAGGTVPEALGVLLLRPVLLLVAALALQAAHLSGLYLNALIVVVDVITIAVIAVLMKRQGRRLTDLLAPRRGAREILWSLLATVIIVIALFAGTYLANAIVYAGPPPLGGSLAKPPLWLGIVGVTIMPVTIGLAEELAYRGYGQQVLQRHWGRIAGLLVMSLCFGLQHVPLSWTTPQAMLARFIGTFIAGLVIGGLVLWFKRLLPIIVGHWLVDLLLLGLPMLLLALAQEA